MQGVEERRIEVYKVSVRKMRGTWDIREVQECVGERFASHPSSWEEKRSPGKRLERRPETGRFAKGKEIIGSCLPDGTTHGVQDSASSVLQKKGYQIINSWRYKSFRFPHDVILLMPSFTTRKISCSLPICKFYTQILYANIFTASPLFL